MYRSTAGGSVRTHLAVLRACGFCRLSSVTRASASWARHSVYRAVTLCITALYLVQECVYAFQVRGDLDKLSRVMFLLLCHVTSIAKQLVFFCNADSVDRLVAQLDAACFNRNGGGYVESQDAARWARRLVVTYAGCAVVTCTLWAVFPAVTWLHGHVVEFPFWIGVDTSSRPHVFVLVLMYSYYVTTLVGIANTTMDAFVAALLDQCKAQLIILRSDFETLPERAERAAGCVAGPHYEGVFRDMFIKCLDHYNKITETVLLFEDTFGMCILVQFGIGGWILCMAGYKTVDAAGAARVELASMVLFTCCILTELFLYCYYGNEITVQSERVSMSVYSMSWCGRSVRMRRAVVVLLCRASRPLHLSAARLVPLSLYTFVKIIKSSYSLYAVLRQTSAASRVPH